MYTRKHQFAGMAILPLFIALTLTASTASSQSYHPKIVTTAQASALDSAQSARLQVLVRQTNATEMRFRVSILNPTGHSVSIQVQKEHDVLFADIIGTSNYDNVFNFSEMEDGDYVILIANGKERIIRTIRIQTQTKVDKQATIE